MSTFAEVPIEWFEKLLAIKQRVNQLPDDLPILMGYIESAEIIIETTKHENNS